MKFTRRNFGKGLFASGLIAASSRALGQEKPGEQMHGHHSASGSVEGKKSIGVLVYDGSLVLDFGIAGEMFAAADFGQEYDVWTFSIEGKPVTPHLVGQIQPFYSLENAPRADLLILPGGMNWPRQAENQELQNFLKNRHQAGSILMGVCSGVFILTAGGFLDGRRAITNWQALSMMHRLAPGVLIAEGEGFVDLGDIVTTAGTGSAMDATLHVIERLSGNAIADDLATRYLDYPYWRA